MREKDLLEHNIGSSEETLSVDATLVQLRGTILSDTEQVGSRASQKVLGSSSAESKKVLGNGSSDIEKVLGTGKQDDNFVQNSDNEVSLPSSKTRSIDQLPVGPGLTLVGKVEVQGGGESFYATFLNEAQHLIMLKGSSGSKYALPLKVKYPELYSPGTTRKDRITIGNTSYQMTLKNSGGTISISLLYEKSILPVLPTVSGPEPLKSVSIDTYINGIHVTRLDVSVYTKSGARLPETWQFAWDAKQRLPYLNGVDEGKVWFDKPLLRINPTSTVCNARYERKDARHGLSIKFMVQIDPKGIARLYVDPSKELLDKYEDTTTKPPVNTPPANTPPVNTTPNTPPKTTPPANKPIPSEEEYDESPIIEEGGRIQEIPSFDRPKFRDKEVKGIYRMVEGVPPPREGKIFTKYAFGKILICCKKLGFVDYTITSVTIQELNSGISLSRKGWTALFRGDELQGPIHAELEDGLLKIVRDVEAGATTVEYEAGVPLLQQRPSDGKKVSSHIHITNPDGSKVHHPGETRKAHQGIDILPNNPEQWPEVKPVLPGEVVYVENGWKDNKFPVDFDEYGESVLKDAQGNRLKYPNGKQMRKHGNYVIVRHNPPGDFFTLYAHLKAGSINVCVGDKVGLHTVIGNMGNSGTVSTKLKNPPTHPAKHLHMEYFRMKKDFGSPEEFSKNKGNRYKSAQHGFKYYDPAVYLPKS